MSQDLRSIAWNRTMGFFHVDQRPVHARCEEILARIPPAPDPDHEARRDVARVELLQLTSAYLLVAGTTPEGVSSLLLAVQKTRDLEAVQRSIARAVPVRGALRAARALLAFAALVALVVLLARISGWLVVAAALPAAWLLVAPFRNLLERGRGWQHVVRMEDAARAAEADGDVEAVNELYAQARRMIGADRVPAHSGFRVAHVLRAAAIATPFPVELLCELQQLLFIAPETELSYADVRQSIERSLRIRVGKLAGRIRESLGDSDACGPARAELRELALHGPGVIGARGHHADILARLARAALDAQPGADLGTLLDEIEVLVERLEALPRGVPPEDGSRSELRNALLDIKSHSSVREAVERARALRGRLEALPSRPEPRRPEPPQRPHVQSRRLLRRIVAAFQRRKTSRLVAELHLVVTESIPLDEQRSRVLALYRQVREATRRPRRPRPLTDLTTAMRLAARWASRSNGRNAALLREIREDARALIAQRRVPADTDADLAGVLRDCVHADEFPITLLDDYAALRQLSSYSVPEHYWSIVDAAVVRAEARIREIARTGDAAVHNRLREIAAAFDATATRTSMREIVDRARKLAAYAAALDSSIDEEPEPDGEQTD